MHEHAGRVEDAAERRPPCRRQRLAEPGAQVARLSAGPDLLSRALEHVPRRGDRERVVAPARELVHRRQVSQPHANECNPASAATLQIMRRVVLITAAVLACLAVAAVAAVGARDAYYWDRPLPGVELREAQLETPVRVVVGGKAYEVRPAEVLRLDGTATEQALWDAGRTSFSRAGCGSSSTRARRPASSTPCSCRGPSSRTSSHACPPRCRSRGEPRSSRTAASASSPRDPGDAVDATQLAASLAKASLTGVRTLSPALTHVEPELTTEAAEAAVAEAKALVDEPIALAFKGEDVGSLAPPRLAKLLRFRPDGDRFRISFHPQARRQGRRADARALAGARRQRPLRRRRGRPSTFGPHARVSPSTGAGQPTRSRPPPPLPSTRPRCA